MASFAVKIVRLLIEPHHNADALEIARVGDYQSIVRKGQFKSGDLAAYIPEQSILPQPLLEEMGLEGKLAGSSHDRVKAIKLRGVLSQGLCYAAREGWAEGQDVTEALGVTKYEPPVPTQMAGQIWAAGHDRCMRYDIENFKMYPDVLAPGEPVVFTEKLHGTWCQIGVVAPELEDAEHGRLVVASKGYASQGLAFKPHAEENAHNLYLRAARLTGLEARLADQPGSVFVLGEVFGQGVQDLAYGASAGSDESLGFRVFDVYVGAPGTGRYLNDDEIDAFCATHELARVPVLYRGPFSREAMIAHTNGRETVSGTQAHIREGIVMRPTTERRHDALGRVQLKSVSEAYLLRKDGTEYT
jgi:RNA ligase (TIGR02306 family)